MSSTNLVTNSSDDTRVSSTPPPSRPFTTKDVQRLNQVVMLARSLPSEMLDRQGELIKQTKDAFEAAVLPCRPLQTIPAHLLEDHVRRLRTACSVAQVIEACLPGALAVLRNNDDMHKMVVIICTLKMQSRRFTPHNPTFIISVDMLNAFLIDMQNFVWRTMEAHDNQNFVKSASKESETSASKELESCASRELEMCKGEDLNPELLKILEDIACLPPRLPSSQSSS
ncbi:uncharacterized protein SCHCODRAFT_02686613 [Schizophyllum commune H4-8]|nr:uncharacterized protein SCHCODRAFT_02686613 [Schizophyllum commune H4-8]KAI5895161.1 hypothetical protein SCHCODRAFT_02686613 [Schizophyllum commune H4-8]